MQGVQQSYTEYFNRFHRKVGHLFQGRYKAIICEKDEYFLELVRYIHLNPLRSGVVKGLEGYRFSGQQVYLEGRGSELLDPRPVLKLLGGTKGYRHFMLDGLGEGDKQEYYEVEDQRFLGSREFGEKVREDVEGRDERAGEKRSLTKVVVELAERLRVSAKALTGPDRSWRCSRARRLVAYLLVRHAGFEVREVAAYLRRDPTTISSLMSRLSKQMLEEAESVNELHRLASCLDIHA
jgi:hypothetical protein